MANVYSLYASISSFASASIFSTLSSDSADFTVTTVSAKVIFLLPSNSFAIPFAAVTGLVLKWGIFWVYMGLAAEQIVKAVAGVIRLRSRQWIVDITRAGNGDGELQPPQ